MLPVPSVLTGSSSAVSAAVQAASSAGGPLQELKFRSLLKHGAMAQSSSQCFFRFF